VDRACPSITPTTISGLGSARSARILGVSYVVNMDGLGVLEGTPEFDTLLFPR
jgi:hypothetical protein